jgi:hypothetical protein
MRRKQASTATYITEDEVIEVGEEEREEDDARS